MVFNNEDEIIDYLKSQQKATEWVNIARENEAQLKALIDGKNFKKLLIHNIEHLEDPKKFKARLKYSRSTKDFFERLLRLTDNVFSANGTTKRYNLKENQEKELVSHLHNIRGGKSLDYWLEAVWMKVYHSDPNGIVFLEYMSDLVKPFPTYKSISAIRHYISNGQKCEVLLFEPKEIKNEKGDDTNKKEWRLVDDVYEYIVIQEDDIYTIVEQNEHLFAAVPAVINSDIEEIGTEIRLSPIQPIVELVKEYAGDYSVFVNYKKLQGFPKHYKIVPPCSSCGGTKLNDQGGQCGKCNGTGKNLTNDVTDEIHLRLAQEGETQLSGDSIAGFINPSIEMLDKFTEALQQLEDSAFLTHWGNISSTKSNATATEIIIDTQPTIQRLNKYADTTEDVEKMLTEYIANHMFVRTKDEENIASINLGRNYIISSLTAVTTEYQDSKEKGDNDVILDDKFKKVLLTQYKNDEIGLMRALNKARVEPYLHYSIEQVKDIYGDKEAQKKGLFHDWWETLTKDQQEGDAFQLKEQFNQWFDSLETTTETENTDTNT